MYTYFKSFRPKWRFAKKDAIGSHFSRPFLATTFPEIPRSTHTILEPISSVRRGQLMVSFVSCRNISFNISICSRGKTFAFMLPLGLQKYDAIAGEEELTY